DRAQELVGVAVQDDRCARGPGQEDLPVLVVDDRELLGGAGLALDGDLSAGGEAEDGQGGESGAEDGATAGCDGHGNLGAEGAGGTVSRRRAGRGRRG